MPGGHFVLRFGAIGDKPLGGVVPVTTLFFGRRGSTSSITVQMWYMIKLNRVLSVWDKNQWHLLTNNQFLMKGHNTRSEAKQSHDQTNWRGQKPIIWNWVFCRYWIVTIKEHHMYILKTFYAVDYVWVVEAKNYFFSIIAIIFGSKYFSVFHLISNALCFNCTFLIIESNWYGKQINCYNWIKYVDMFVFCPF